MHNVHHSTALFSQTTRVNQTGTVSQQAKHAPARMTTLTNVTIVRLGNKSERHRLDRKDLWAPQFLTVLIGRSAPSVFSLQHHQCFHTFFFIKVTVSLRRRATTSWVRSVALLLPRLSLSPLSCTHTHSHTPPLTKVDKFPQWLLTQLPLSSGATSRCCFHSHPGSRTNCLVALLTPAYY